MPATLSLVIELETQERAKRSRLAAVFGGLSFGPLGGYLLQDYEWNAVFLVNLPVVLVALIGGHFFRRRGMRMPRRRTIWGVVDHGLFALVYGSSAGVKATRQRAVFARPAGGS